MGTSVDSPAVDSPARTSRRESLAEGIGTAVLVATVIGSGIMAQNLAPGQVLLQLLCNALATVAVLGVLIAVLGPISGAHFNPAVTLVEVISGDRGWSGGFSFVASQIIGACGGALLAHGMFDQRLIQFTGRARDGLPLLVGEAVATAGLLLVITILVRSDRAGLCAVVVPAWILAAYFFTSSTSFANPAVTIGRALTGSFAGIAWWSVPLFIVAQLTGAALGAAAGRILTPRKVRPA